MKSLRESSMEILKEILKGTLDRNPYGVHAKSLRKFATEILHGIQGILYGNTLWTHLRIPLWNSSMELFMEMFYGIFYGIPLWRFSMESSMEMLKTSFVEILYGKHERNPPWK